MHHYILCYKFMLKPKLEDLGLGAARKVEAQSLDTGYRAQSYHFGGELREQERHILASHTSISLSV